MNVEVIIPRAVLEMPQNAHAAINGAFIRMNQDINKRIKENAYSGNHMMIRRTGKYATAIKMSAYQQLSPTSPAEQTHYIDTKIIPWAMVHEGIDGRTQTVITPKNGKWLTFRLMNPGDTTQATGKWIRTKQVIVKIRPLLRPAAEQIAGNFPHYLEQYMQYMTGKKEVK